MQPVSQIEIMGNLDEPGDEEEVSDSNRLPKNPSLVIARRSFCNEAISHPLIL
jgi:hypothetical protein